MKKMKELWNKIKLSKNVVTYIAALAVVIVCLAGAGAIAAEKLEASQEKKASDAMTVLLNNQAQAAGITLITESEAKGIAFEAAGVQENDVKYLEVFLDTEDDKQTVSYVYEVEFAYNGLTYEFEIDGVEQTVLESNVESILD